jgi:hypothetical protein
MNAHIKTIDVLWPAPAAVVLGVHLTADPVMGMGRTSLGVQTSGEVFFQVSLRANHLA